jgi:integrase
MKGTLEQLFEEWLALAAPSFSPQTVATTRGYLNLPILPALGRIHAAKLTSRDLDRFYRQLLEVGGPKGPYAPGTIRRIHGIIRRALAQGVRWGWITHNPALDASPPKVPHRSLTPPTPREVARLFKLAQATDPQLATFVMLAACTGARRGELLALRRGDIDLERCVLNIERGVVLAGGKLIEQGTKTHQARRVTIDTETSSTLRSHLQAQDAQATSIGTSMRRDAFVFSYAVDGSLPWRPDSTTRAFRVPCAEADIQGVRLHDLRHYVATRLLTAGIDARTVAGRLGHRNPSTTLDVYSHFVPESDQAASETMSLLFSSAMKDVDDDQET